MERNQGEFTLLGCTVPLRKWVYGVQKQKTTLVKFDIECIWASTRWYVCPVGL